MTRKRWRLLVVVCSLLAMSVGGTSCDCMTHISVKHKSVTEGPVAEAWLCYYRGPKDGADTANAIAVDEGGNVYVTGIDSIGGYPQMATIKYDHRGKQLWVATYRPENSFSYGKAIAVDAQGNVYVAGGCGGHYVTAKYDTNGKEVWVKSYDVTGYAIAIAIDGSGNVYITGHRQSGGDNACVKYDADGNELWARHFSGVPCDMVVDDRGNVYVTGYRYDAGPEFVIAKYDTAGNELWLAQYDGPAGTGEDKALAIAVDASGNVYVTGSSEGTDTGRDYATIKYDSNGNQLWVARYDGSPTKGESDANGLLTTSDDEAHDIVVDESGHVCVTGWSKGGDAIYDSATVMYDSNGNQLWVQCCDGARGEAIAVDAGGNVYVTGGGRTTIKYDSDGNQVWMARYVCTRANTTSGGNTAIALDSSGNVYVTGSVILTVGHPTALSGDVPDQYAYATTKYTQQT